MPELPEVEYARRCLERWLVGVRIERASASPGRPLRGVTPEEIARTLPGRTVREVKRHGKQLLWSLDRGLGVHLHLGMTGKIVRRRAGAEPARHSRLRLALGDGDAVELVDPRRFGRFELGPLARLEALPELQSLGPDALDEAPDGPGLARLMRGKRPLKVALMDQRRLAGLGNIQASESLFRARLSPRARPADLRPADWRRLSRAIQASLAHTLRAAPPPGEGDIHYVEEGGGEAPPNPFLVYRREGEPCPRCGEPIARTVQAQRSTYHCPSCQH